jgi:hypothetical protein
MRLILPLSAAVLLVPLFLFPLSVRPCWLDSLLRLSLVQAALAAHADVDFTPCEKVDASLPGATCNGTNFDFSKLRNQSDGTE